VQNGLEWKALWDHPENAELKQLRKDPAVLKPGDVVKIPPKEPKEKSVATDKKHQFVRKGTPAKVRIKVLRDDKPRANLPYRLDIDGRLETGNTDAQGLVEMTIPPDAKQGELAVGKPGDEEIFHFQLGAVDPIDTEEGVRGRLRDLGYDDTLPMAELLKEFQSKEKLSPPSGSLDEATKAKLKAKFGQ
jgi:N-acetylmuramoyl-L-alanine amidase